MSVYIHAYLYVRLKLEYQVYLIQHGDMVLQLDVSMLKMVSAMALKRSGWPRLYEIQ